MTEKPKGPEPERDDDAPLLDAARAGDPEALESLFQAHLGYVKDRVHQMAPRDGGLRESDFVQSAILRAIEGMAGFTGTSRGAFLSWLGTIVKNTVRQRQRFQAAAKRAAGTTGSGIEELASMMRTPSAEASGIDALITLGRALRRLTTEQRRAIELRVIDEAPYSVVAAELGLNEGAARMAVSRARAVLAMELAKIEGTGATD